MKIFEDFFDSEKQDEFPVEHNSPQEDDFGVMKKSPLVSPIIFDDESDEDGVPEEDSFELMEELPLVNPIIFDDESDEDESQEEDSSELMEESMRATPTELVPSQGIENCGEDSPSKIIPYILQPEFSQLLVPEKKPGKCPYL